MTADGVPDADERLEAFLASVYVDPERRARFLVDPAGEARRAGLPDPLADALVDIDRVGLELVAQSLERKRRQRARHRHEYPLGH